MTKKYRYALGIDMGIASLGTGLTLLDENGCAKGFLDAGVRIFATPEGAATRRKNRLERTSKRHKKQRLQKVTALLIQHGLWTADPQKQKTLLDISPYFLRADGVQTPFDDIYKLGRCLLHLVRFRGAGFLSESEPDGMADESGTKKKDAQKTANRYRVLESTLAEKNWTISQLMSERLAVKKPVRQRTRFVDTEQEEMRVWYSVPRFLVKKEFFALWNTQASQYSLQLTPALRETLYDAIFSDMPRAPYATGSCIYYENEERLPLMHRLTETRRIYEQVHNLRFVTSSMECPPTRDLRDALVARLLNGEELTKSLIKAEAEKYFVDKIRRINMSETAGSAGNKIKGLCLTRAFADMPEWFALSLYEQDELIDFIANPVNTQAQENKEVLYSEEEFLERCLAKLHLPNEESVKIRLSACLQKLPEGRSALGRTATAKILEQLELGKTIQGDDGKEYWRAISQREAADLCHFEAEEEEARRLAGTYDVLPYYGKILRHDISPIHPWHKDRAAEEEKIGRVPNPVVHVCLNQLRKVVNEIIALYGKPERINLELARDFGLSAKKRDEQERERIQRTKDNESWNTFLESQNLRPTRKNRIKYRLWKEQGGLDMYTGNNIQVSDFASCEIDHIIPRALGGSDTYANLTLTAGNVNREKGDRFAYEFMQSPANKAYWGTLLSRIQNDKFPPNKAWRFLENAKERYTIQGDEEATDSRMTDTSYMAKMAQRYLKAICSNVVPIRGGMTAQLRHAWGTDALEYELMGLNIPHYLGEKKNPETGEIECYENGNPIKIINPSWSAKPRIDHRHHALDALVLSTLTRAHAKVMYTAEKRRENLHLAAPFGAENGEFRQKILHCLQKVNISHKAEHGVEGQLHNETACRILSYNEEDGLYTIVYKRAFSNLTSKKDIENLTPNKNLDFSESVQKILADCERQKNAIEEQYSFAENILQERNAINKADSKKEAKITEKLIVLEAIRLAQKNGKIGTSYAKLDRLSLVNIREKEKCGYKADGNACVDFYEDSKGKVGWECICLFDVAQKDFIPAWQKAGYKLIWRIFKGDMLELTPTEDLKERLQLNNDCGMIRIVVQMFSKNLIQCILVNDARPKDQKQKIHCITTGGLGLRSYTLASARKIELTPFGKLKRKHKKLWYGKKTPPTV